MQVDIIAGALVVIGIWLGFRSGGTLQFLRLLVAVASVGLAYVVAGELGQFYQGRFGGTALSAVASAFFASLAVIWFLLSFLLGKLTRDMASVAEDLPALSRIAGIVVGAARGAVLAYVVILGLLAMYETRGTPELPYDESHAAVWIRDNDLLERPIERLDAVMEDEDRTFSPFGDIDEQLERQDPGSDD